MARDRRRLVVGFAAETDDVIAHATAKRARKGCDWIVANDVSPGDRDHGRDGERRDPDHRTGAEAWPRMSKAETARRLAARIADALEHERHGVRRGFLER
jgi:phosphopantothenoylcysteine decarboxylase/phosphopantothenate--cysteine ligase